MCVYINLYDYSKTTLEIWLYGVHHAVAKASVQLYKKQFSGGNLSKSKQLVFIVQSYFRQLVVVYSSLYIAGPHHSVCDGCRSGLSLCSQK